MTKETQKVNIVFASGKTTTVTCPTKEAALDLIGRKFSRTQDFLCSDDGYYVSFENVDFMELLE